MITTYEELKSAVQNWLERSGDSTITDRDEEFIALAEARLNREVRNLRIAKQTDATLVGTPNSRSLTLPTDFLWPLSLYLTTYSTQILLRPIVAGRHELGTANSVPAAWMIRGTSIDLDAPCDQAHTFLLWYRQKFALSDSETTNELLTDYPDIYLYASLAEAAVFLKDYDAAAGYESLLRPRLRDLKVTEAENVRMAPATVDRALQGGHRFDINTGD